MSVPQAQGLGFVLCPVPEVASVEWLVIEDMNKYPEFFFLLIQKKIRKEHKAKKKKINLWPTQSPEYVPYFLYVLLKSLNTNLAFGFSQSKWKGDIAVPVEFSALFAFDNI